MKNYVIKSFPKGFILGVILFLFLNVVRLSQAEPNNHILVIPAAFISLVMLFGTLYLFFESESVQQGLLNIGTCAALMVLSACITKCYYAAEWETLEDITVFLTCSFVFTLLFLCGLMFKSLLSRNKGAWYNDGCVWYAAIIFPILYDLLM